MSDTKTELDDVVEVALDDNVATFRPAPHDTGAVSDGPVDEPMAPTETPGYPCS